MCIMVFKNVSCQSFMEDFTFFFGWGVGVGVGVKYKDLGGGGSSRPQC